MCICALAIEEDDDNISLDMCGGDFGKTGVHFSILSGLSISNNVRITESNQGKRFAVSICQDERR